jgi:hypothetical protein
MSTNAQSTSSFIRTTLRAMLLLGLALTSMQARAQLAACISGPADLMALCRAMQTSTWNLRAPTHLHDVVDVLAQVIVSSPANSKPSEAFDTALDSVIRASLTGTAKAYCDAVATESHGSFAGSVVATACIRPVCLLPQTAFGAGEKRPTQCNSISEAMRAALLKAAQQAGQKIYGACDPEKPADPPTCQHLEAQIASIVVLADQVHPLITAARGSDGKGLSECGSGKKTADCAATISTFLDRALLDYTEASAVDMVFTSYPAIAEVVDADKRFRAQWAKIKTAEEYAHSGKREREFPWDLDLFKEFVAMEPLFAAMTKQMGEALQQDTARRLLETWTRGASLVVVISQNPVAMKDTELSKFVGTWKSQFDKLGPSPKPVALLTASQQLEELLPEISNVEAKLKLIARQLVFGNSPISFQQCTAGQVQLDFNGGTADFCFPANNPMKAIAGIRFAFAACAPGVQVCDTTGDLRVLVLVTAVNGKGDSAAIPLGITSVKARVSASGVALAGLPPHPVLRTDKPAVLAALRQLIPEPLEILDYATLNMSDGPALEFTQLRFRFAALGIPELVIPKLTISRAGILANGSSFQESVRAALEAAIRGRSSIAGFSTSQIRLLKDKETCGNLTYSKEILFGFCLTLNLPFPNQDVALTAELDLDNSGHSVLRPAFDAVSLYPKIDSALRSMFPPIAADLQSPHIEGLLIDGNGVQLALQASPQCSAHVNVPLTGKAITPEDLLRQNREFFKCEGKDVLSSALRNFTLFGLTFSDIQGNRICLPSPSGVCIVGPVVAPDGTHVDFSHVRLDDGGQLTSLLSQKLAAIVPPAIASIASVEISGKQLKITTSLSLPGFGAPVLVPILCGGEVSLAVDLKELLIPRIAEVLKNKSAKWGALEMTIMSADWINSELTVHGSVSFDAVTVAIDVELIPQFRVKPPKLDQAAIGVALKALNALSGDSGAELLMEANYQFVLRVPVKVTVPIGSFDGLQVGAVFEARLNQKGFRFAGPVFISVPIWIPTGPYVDIGNLQATVDLNTHDDYGIGASLAITPGEASHEVVSFNGMLSISRSVSTVTLTGTLTVLEVPVSTVEGKWQTSEGVLRVNTTSVFGNLLPIPQIQLIVDGPACVISGKASVKFVGIDLLNGTAGLLLPRPPCPSNPKVTPETAAIIQLCGSPGQNGVVCLNGEASLGNITSASVNYNSGLLIPIPRASAHFSVGSIAGIGVDATAAITQLDADVLGFDISVYLPSLDHVTGDDIVALFRNLLRPSLSLDALLSGKIVIAPTSGEGKGKPSSGQSGGGEAAPQSGRTGEPAHNTGVSPILTSRSGSVVVTIEDIPGWPSAAQLVAKQDTQTFPYYRAQPVFLRTHVEADLFRKKQLLPVPSAVVGSLPNGRPFILACNTQRENCKSTTLSLVPLLQPPGETSFTDSVTPLANLSAGTPELWANGDLLTPAFANYLASRLIANVTVPPVIQCISEWHAHCYGMLVKDENPQNPWHVFNYQQRDVQSGSFLDQLTSTWCPAGACTTDVINVIKDAEDSLGVLGWAVGKDKSLSIIETSYQNEVFRLLYHHYDASLHLADENVIVPIGIGYWGSFGLTAKPSTQSWSSLASTLQSLKLEPKTSWSMERSIERSRELYALVGQGPSSKERTVISGVSRSDGSFCVRTNSYAGILKNLDDKWAVGKPGDFGDSIDDSALKKLNDSQDGTELLTALTHPVVSDTGYRISPILWMGNPADATQCVNK